MVTKLVLMRNVFRLQVMQWYLLMLIEMRMTFMLKKTQNTTLMVTPCSCKFEREIKEARKYFDSNENIILP